MTKLKVIDDALTRSTGPNTASPLIFLHAFGDTGHCYEKIFASRFLNEYQLIAIDLWGFGASPRRADTQTIADYSKALENLVSKLCPQQAVGLIGHSIAGSIAVEMAAGLGNKVFGVFSIEGNLTPDDAMFTGKATNFDDPDSFKKSFLDDIWELGQKSDALRHYYSGARMADPHTMWHLGRDAKRISANNKLGAAFQKLSQPALYYWSKASTPQKTQKWIQQSGISNEVYANAGHWPMIEQPEATAKSISEFFRKIDT